MEPTNHLVIIEEEQTLEKENDTGVKRVEPLRGSERFLDSLSRIPEGNPTTNDSVLHNGNILENVSEAECLFFDEATYDCIDTYVHEQSLEVMYEDQHNRICKEVTPIMFHVVLGTVDQDQFDDVEYEDIYDFVDARVDVYLTTMCLPRSYPRGQELHSSLTPKETCLLKQKLAQLCTVYQPQHCTQEWYDFRHNVLTASEIGNIMGTESSVNRAIYSKCCPQSMTDSANRSVNVLSPMHWGQKYEPVTLMVYEQTYDTRVQEFGCIRHPTYPCIAASPDGINMDENSPKYGRMVEIKNIVNRDITGIPLTKYWIQMQIQMEVCDLEMCDFVETRFKEYDQWKEILTDTRMIRKGVMLYFVRKNDPLGNPHYIYMPLHIPLRKETIISWIERQQNGLSELYMLHQVIAWYLDEISCVVVPRHRAWFHAACPKLLDTWNIIERERTEGYSHREPAKSKPKVRSNKLMVDVTKLE